MHDIDIDETIKNNPMVDKELLKRARDIAEKQRIKGRSGTRFDLDQAFGKVHIARIAKSTK